MSSAAAPAAVGSGKELANPPADGITNLRFSNHSNNLLVSSWDKTVRLYDADANVLKGEFMHPGAVLDCCFHDDSSGFSAGADHTVRRLVFSSSKEDVLGRHDGPVRCVEYSYAAGQVITGSWDKTVKCWDPRGVSGPERTLVGTYAQPERVYSLSLVGNRLVVATAGRHVNIYDLRNMSQPEQKRDSSLKYQTRCVRCFPNGTGNWPLGARVHDCGNLDPGKRKQNSFPGNKAWQRCLHLGSQVPALVQPSSRGLPTPQESVPLIVGNFSCRYAFKCHRKSEAGRDTVYPVNAIAFHPIYGTFATGGCDGFVNVWDGINKKRLYQYSKYASSIAALSFSKDGHLLAVASSYTYEEGEKTHEPDAIFIRTVNEVEVKPKPKALAAPQ
ncbi:Putative pentatricopeptide repeat-containing protein mitochondrial [Zea mays]|uniref:Putative pentatricopeptide repeat-containing protein mitochondrial n=3 Tax=Magnoliopsida TaxID=3398 RepID=A0A1D6NVQ7_MAIZE|nr:Putative pentatricopeptide repeat-containing protein mitochondrial [Zea mays]